MNETDFLILSIIFNAIMLVQNWRAHKLIAKSNYITSKLVFVLGAIAHKKASASVDSEGKVVVKGAEGSYEIN
jgi:hypothetical protein